MTAPPSETKSSRRPVGLIVIVALFLLAVGAFLLVRARQNSLVGQWQATDTETDGAVETTTVRFLADGLMTFQVKTSKGSLLRINGGGLFGGSSGGSQKAGGPPSGGLADVFAAMFPTIARASIKGTYTIKDDVLTLKVADVNFFDAQDQPVSLSGETHPASQTFQFQKRGGVLTMDKLDGTPPLKLTRQTE